MCVQLCISMLDCIVDSDRLFLFFFFSSFERDKVQHTRYTLRLHRFAEMCRIKLRILWYFAGKLFWVVYLMHPKWAILINVLCWHFAEPLARQMASMLLLTDPLHWTLRRISLFCFIGFHWIQVWCISFIVGFRSSIFRRYTAPARCACISCTFTIIYCFIFIYIWIFRVVVCERWWIVGRVNVSRALVFNPDIQFKAVAVNVVMRCIFIQINIIFFVVKMLRNFDAKSISWIHFFFFKFWFQVFVKYNWFNLFGHLLLLLLLLCLSAVRLDTKCPIVIPNCN